MSYIIEGILHTSLFFVHCLTSIVSIHFLVCLHVLSKQMHGIRAFIFYHCTFIHSVFYETSQVWYELHYIMRASFFSNNKGRKQSKKELYIFIIHYIIRILKSKYVTYSSKCSKFSPITYH